MESTHLYQRTLKRGIRIHSIQIENNEQTKSIHSVKSCRDGLKGLIVAHSWETEVVYIHGR